MLSQHWLTNLNKARVTPYDMKIFQELHYVAGKLRIYMFARVTNDLSLSLLLCQIQTVRKRKTLFWKGNGV